ncbi:Inositol oxygenase [Leucoagaricus sp. SymC.cos]|nr:Inositol oxygenase [Leucoagaricus sp. SymC.cos]
MRTPISQQLEASSDAVDEVNQLKGRLWNSAAKFSEDKDTTTFRQYSEACDRVKLFYREQHAKQTLNFNIEIRKRFAKLDHAEMGIWEAVEILDTMQDDSDPDTSVSQIEHLLQTAEAIRRDKKPEWMQVIGLIHDLGKLLATFQPEGQWAIVGDTFPVGCHFSDKNIYPETFSSNPDSKDKKLLTECGIYEPHCGLDKVLLSWGHDEYLYLVLKDQCTLPKEGLWMIRYHSFYPWHREGAYKHLCNAEDDQALAAVQAFNPYDLYSKSDDPVDPEKLKPYYTDLIAKFFPEKLRW